MPVLSGVDRNQTQILSYDDMVDETSVVRIIDRFVDVTNINDLGFTWAGGKDIGRPAYPVSALVKLYVYGYSNGIRSSRKLEQETHRNIEAIWLMSGLTPDHKAISEFRRINTIPLKALFKSFVKLCRRWDLVGDEVLAFDGTKIKANNNSYKNYNRKKLENKLRAIDEKIQRYLDEMDEQDRVESIDRLSKNRAYYEDIMRRLNESSANQISTTDPDAVVMENKKGGLEPGYNVQSVVDEKYDIVVEVETTTSSVDQGLLSAMVEQVQGNSSNTAFIALADKGYWQGADLQKVEDLGVTPIVAPQNNAPHSGQSSEYTIEKFQFDSENNEYICPCGERLVCHQVWGKQYRRYFNKSACAVCPVKAECVGRAKLGFKVINRGIYAEALERNAERVKKNRELYHRRQELVEHPFGTVKRSLGFTYFLMRTLPKVAAETSLIFLGYNIKRAVSVLGFEGVMSRLAAI